MGVRDVSARLSRGTPGGSVNARYSAPLLLEFPVPEIKRLSGGREQLIGVFNESPNKLSGFFRGFRNGFFWSLPVFVSLTIFIATYGRNPPPIYAAMLEAFQIPAIWMLIAGFVSGRVADQKDVEDGNAAFVAFGGVKTDLSNTVVPQYALFTDDNGNPVRVIVIQAEVVHSEKGDIEAFGLRSIDSGDLILGVSESVRLLGTTNPDVEQ
jgi:hypothetical protein